jgi:hypothetical protein
MAHKGHKKFLLYHEEVINAIEEYGILTVKEIFTCLKKRGAKWLKYINLKTIAKIIVILHKQHRVFPIFSSYATKWCVAI